MPGRILSVSVDCLAEPPQSPQKVRTTNALIFKMKKQEIQRGTVPGPGSHSTKVAEQGVDSVWPYPNPPPPSNFLF